MIQVNRIDQDGMFVEPIVLEDGETLTEPITNEDGLVTYQPRTDIITVPVPEGFHYPKWDGAAWVEGKTDADLLAIAKAAKLIELATARDAAIEVGFTSGTNNYGYNAVDQKNMRGQALDLMIDSSVDTVYFMTQNNGLVAHSRDLFIQVCKDAKAHEEGQWTNCFTLEAQVNAATTIADVNAIVW